MENVKWRFPHFPKLAVFPREFGSHPPSPSLLTTYVFWVKLYQGDRGL